MMSTKRRLGWPFSRRRSVDNECPIENVNENLPEEEDQQYQYQTGRHTGGPTKQGDVAQAVVQSSAALLNFGLPLGKSAKPKIA